MNYFEILPQDLLWIIYVKCKDDIKLKIFNPFVNKLICGDFHPDIILNNKPPLDMQYLFGAPATPHLERIKKVVKSECVDVFYYTDEDLVAWYRTKILYKTKCDYVWILLDITDGACGYELVGNPIIKRSNDWKEVWFSLKKDKFPVLSYHGYKWIVY